MTALGAPCSGPNWVKTLLVQWHREGLIEIALSLVWLAGLPLDVHTL